MDCGAGTSKTASSSTSAHLPHGRRPRPSGSLGSQHPQSVTTQCAVGNPSGSGCVAAGAASAAPARVCPRDRASEGRRGPVTAGGRREPGGRRRSRRGSPQRWESGRCRSSRRRASAGSDQPRPIRLSWRVLGLPARRGQVRWWFENRGRGSSGSRRSPAVSILWSAGLLGSTQTRSPVRDGCSSTRTCVPSTPVPQAHRRPQPSQYAGARASTCSRAIDAVGRSRRRRLPRVSPRAHRVGESPTRRGASSMSHRSPWGRQRGVVSWPLWMAQFMARAIGMSSATATAGPGPQRMRPSGCGCTSRASLRLRPACHTQRMSSPHAGHRVLVGSCWSCRSGTTRHNHWLRLAWWIIDSCTGKAEG